MTTRDYQALAADLSSLLTLQAPPLAITFSEAAPADVPPYEGSMPAPTPDGRTGKVSAGCVFWMKATERTFTTRPEDHAQLQCG
jgi:hypothetical protein